MKQIIVIIFTAFLITACGNNKKQSVEDVIASQDLALIRKKKSELDIKQQELATQIQLLEVEIKELDPQEKVPLVSTFTADESKFTHYVELQGNVSTKKNLIIFPEYAGTLTRVFVKEGQRVSKGQTLAKIDDGGLNQQLAQMQIQADLAKTTYERQKRLWDQKIGSEIQFLQAKSSYEGQQQVVNQMQQQIGKTIVRAPFSGTIDDVITEQGSVVAPGQSQLFRIVNLDDMYIETDVPERYLTNITNGKSVEVEFPILGETVEAEVRQAGNFINPANRTFKVEIDVPNKNGTIKPNLTAKVKINDYTNEKALLIPQSIISENAQGQQYVYIITDKSEGKGIAKRVFIETGRAKGDLIEVISGLNHGDEIIDEGARSVKNDQDVKILPVE